VKKADALKSLQTPQGFNGVAVIVWGTNQWRESKRDELETLLPNLKTFVSNGGDLVFNEQFAMENMNLVESAFGIRTAGDGKDAEIVDEALKTRATASGLTEDAVRKLRFYNSYYKFPTGTRVLVKSAKDERALAILAPFGKGRLLFIGTNVDPEEAKIVKAILETVYRPEPARR
jgi:hypothetical protein